MLIQMSLFMALYGYQAPSFLDLLFGDSRVPKAKDLLQESDVRQGGGIDLVTV